MLFASQCRRCLRSREHGRLTEIHPQMEAEIRSNREAGYGQACLDASSGKSLFLRHALMISRMRFMLERACWGSDGRVEMSMFRPDLDTYRVTAPAISAIRKADGSGYVWTELDHEEKLPVKPDAIFSLQVRGNQTSLQPDSPLCVRG